MADEMVGSALVRRHIGRRFRTLREKAGLTMEQAAKLADRGRATIARIEDGEDAVRFREPDVRHLLSMYGATAEETELLLALAAETRNGKSKSWWHDRTDSAIPGFFGFYIMFEDSAERIRTYEIELVPGLLQTRAYAEHVHRGPAGYVSDAEVAQRVAVRIERQGLLTRARPPRLEVIINEAILRREVGGPDVMSGQLDHLLTVSQWPTVSLRILPFAAGLHGGMASGTPFSILDFPTDSHGEPLEPTLAYVDTLTGALYLQKPDEVAAYELAWRDLEEKALDDKASRDFIRDTQRGQHRV